MRKNTLWFLFLLCLLLNGCTTRQSPAAPAEVTIAPAPGPETDYSSLRLNELMVHNSATLLRDGAFPDWIELYNDADTPLSLEGLVLSDGSKTHTLSGLSIAAKSELLLFCGDGEGDVHFSLSDKDTLTLSTPDGIVLSSCDCSGSEENCSLAFSEGSYELSRYPTPGYPNSDEGYARFRLSLQSQSPLSINEVFAHGNEKQETFDWVELCNTGDSPLSLSDYALSDRAEQSGKLRLPDVTLAPGELYLCTLGDGSFSLDDETEQLYLFCRETIVDCACLRDLPTGGSIGRENGRGWYYYALPTPMEVNRSGAVQIAEAPVLLERDGVFALGETVSAALQGEGKLYYTLDGSRPDETSALYTAPLTIQRDTILRAVSVVPGKLCSEVSCFSFLFTDTALPVVSLVGDTPYELEKLKHMGSKLPEIPGVLSLYEEDGSFTIPCGIRLSGNSSIKQHSKSFKVYFRSCFGASALHYDVFDTGVSNYHSLGLRRGYDSLKSMFKNELFESLALSFTELCPAQKSKFCQMYINGSYWGIVSLRDDFSATYFSENYGGKKSSVEYFKFPVDKHSEFYAEVLSFCRQHPNEGEYVYEQLRGTLDMDSLIDWMIVKGFSGDMDYFPNVACYRSSATGYRWRFLLWDFDMAGHSPFMNMVISFDDEYYSYDLAVILKALLASESFRERFVARFAEALRGPFRTENILALIDSYEALLQEEVPADHQQWQIPLRVWEKEVEQLRKTFSDPGWRQELIENLRKFPHFEDMDLRALEE